GRPRHRGDPRAHARTPWASGRPDDAARGVLLLTRGPRPAFVVVLASGAPDSPRRAQPVLAWALWPSATMADVGLEADLVAALGPERVRVDGHSLALYGRDASMIDGGSAAVVCFASST